MFVQMSVKVLCQLSLGGVIIFFFCYFISSLKTLAASRLDTGNACLPGSAFCPASPQMLYLLIYLRAIHHFLGLSLSHPGYFLEGGCCEEPGHFDMLGSLGMPGSLTVPASCSSRFWVPSASASPSKVARINSSCH